MPQHSQGIRGDVKHRIELRLLHARGRNLILEPFDGSTAEGAKVDLGNETKLGLASLAPHPKSVG
jgi:hypothetical protein